VIVVHAWWSAAADAVGDDDATIGVGGMLVWAEDSALPLVPPRRAGRRPRTQDHPFAVGADELAKLLGLSSIGATPPRDSIAVLALPTRGAAPAASPELVVTTDEDAFEIGISEGLWRVPVVELAPDDALALLRATTDNARDDIGDDDSAVFGADFRFLRTISAFAADLVARGRVLPWISPVGPGRAAAVWRPVVTGADAEWLRATVVALPASGFACVDNDGARPSASALIARATDELVDAAVREALPTKPKPQRGRRKAAASWRRALTGPDRIFDANPAEIAAIAEALATWQRDAISGGTVRACFRLVEPRDDIDDADDGPDAADWRVEFALQAVDEPSLVVDAARVWKARGPVRALARHVRDPHETLLAELGRAMRLYPDIGRALRTAKPAELRLDTAQARSFLVDAAPLLVASGFGVHLPGWWTNPSARLGARLKASTPSQPGSAGGEAGIGQEVLVDFDWQLAIGKETLTEDEIDALVDAQQPLVRVRGQWIAVDPDRLARARAFFAKRGCHRSGQMTLGDVLRSLGSADDGPGGLPVVGVDAEGWLAEFLSPQADTRLKPLTAPPGFIGSLRPYQERGLAWLVFLESIGLGGLLADDMGLGKTIQLLALFARDVEALQSDDEVQPTLLVCPMSLVGNWQREAAKFTPSLRIHVHHGAERPRGKAFAAAVASSDVVVTTYSLLTRDVADLGKVAWRRVVLDEAQAVKNAATKAAVAVRSLQSRRRIAVTGTPVENRLADLWSLMEFANPGLLGNPTSFKERYAKPIERQGDANASARLRALTQPFVLRRVKTDTSIISDLPAKLEMEVVCSLTREQVSLYQAVVADMLDRIATTTGIERRGLVLATMTKLKQVCNHPAQFLRDGSRLAGRSGKLARLEETLEEVLAAGEKALLFTQYAEFGAMLRTRLSARFGGEVAHLHGGVAKPERDAMVERFQASDRRGPSLFVLSLKAGGTGLTLTAANHVIHVDRWWNPAVEDQATDRAFRIGQKRAVQVRKFVCAGTLEEKISAMINDKRGLAASIVGTGEGWLTELSTAQLRELFTLEAGEAVE
jgi:hypothetical protein